MARGIFTLSRVRTKKIKDEWIDYSDVWHYQGNPVNRSAYGFSQHTHIEQTEFSALFNASTIVDKLSFDTETASFLPEISNDGDNRWMLANSRDMYYCGGGDYPVDQLSLGANIGDGGVGQHVVKKISFSNDSQSSIPSVTLDRIDYDPVVGEFGDKTKGLENTLAVGEKEASTLGNNNAGYIIGGKKYDLVNDDYFHGTGFVYYNSEGYASSQYYKINYSNDAKSVLPGSSTGQSYRGAYFLTFGNLDRGYVGGGEAAGSDSPYTISYYPTKFWNYSGHGPWQFHYNSAMFRLTYSTETSSRVPSLDLGAYQAGNDTYFGYRSPSFSNGADGNSTEAYTMGRDSSDYEGYGQVYDRNATSTINKITFSTETISAVSGANRSTYPRSDDNDRKEGFDVRSASSGTSVYAMANAGAGIFADKFNISSGTVTTLTSTGLRTNMFASATGQGKPYQGGYQIPLDRGPATNYYGQSGTPPAETIAEDPYIQYHGGPTYGYIINEGMYLHKISTDLSVNTDHNNLINPKFYGIGINLGTSWMFSGNLTSGAGNGWFRWMDNTTGPGSGSDPNAAAVRSQTLPVLASAALSNGSAAYVSGGVERVDGYSFPVTTTGLALRSGDLLRSDTHKINYVNDVVTRLPSSNLPRENGAAQHGGNEDVGYILGGYVHGTESAYVSPFGRASDIYGDMPFNSDCEKITYSTETYSTIPTNAPPSGTGSAFYLTPTVHTIGTMDYLYYNTGAPGQQKFTFSTESFSALPNVSTSVTSGYVRTSNGVDAMLYGHAGDSYIGRIQFSTDTLVSQHGNLWSGNELFGNQADAYSYFDGTYFRIILDDGEMFRQDPSTGSIYHTSSDSLNKGPSQTTTYQKHHGTCNRNNGMAGPAPRTVQYNERTLV